MNEQLGNLWIEIKGSAENLLSAVDKSKIALTNFAQDSEKILAKTAQGLQTVGMAMAAVGSAATGMAVLSVKSFADFEQAMKNVQSVSLATEGEFKTLSAFAKKLGEDTVFSAKDAADAMYFLASAGYNAQQQMQSTAAILDFAAATQSDLAASTELVVGTLNAFNLPATEASRVTNTFAAAIGASQLQMQDLSTAMPYVSSQFKLLGYPVEDAAAALGVLRDNGLKAEMAGTRLRDMLTDLMEPTDKAEAALKEIGLTAKDVSPTTHSLSELVRTFGDALKKSGKEAETAEIFTRIFGKTSEGMSLLVSAGADKLEQMADKITGTNASAKMAAIQLDSLKGEFALLKSAAEGLGLSFGQALTPMVRDFTQTLTGVIHKLNQMDPVITNTIARFGALAGGFTLVTGGGLILLSQIPRLVQGLKDFSILMDKLPGQMGKVVTSLGAIGIAATAAYTAYRAWKDFEPTLNQHKVQVQATQKETERLAEAVKYLSEAQARGRKEVSANDDAFKGLYISAFKTREGYIGVDKALGIFRKQLDDTKETFKIIEKPASFYEDQIKKIGIATEFLTKANEVHIAKIRANKEEFEGLNLKLAQNTDGSINVKKALEVLNTQLASNKDMLKKMGQEYINVDEEVAKYRATQEKVRKELEAAKKAAEGLTISWEDLKKKGDAYFDVAGEGYKANIAQQIAWWEEQKKLLKEGTEAWRGATNTIKSLLSEAMKLDVGDVSFLDPKDVKFKAREVEDILAGLYKTTITLQQKAADEQTSIVQRQADGTTAIVRRAGKEEISIKTVDREVLQAEGEKYAKFLKVLNEIEVGDKKLTVQELALLDASIIETSIQLAEKDQKRQEEISAQNVADQKKTAEAIQQIRQAYWAQIKKESEIIQKFRQENIAGMANETEQVRIEYNEMLDLYKKYGLDTIELEKWRDTEIAKIRTKALNDFIGGIADFGEKIKSLYEMIGGEEESWLGESIGFMATWVDNWRESVKEIQSLVGDIKSAISGISKALSSVSEAKAEGGGITSILGGLSGGLGVAGLGVGIYSAIKTYYAKEHELALEREKQRAEEREKQKKEQDQEMLDEIVKLQNHYKLLAEEHAKNSEKVAQIEQEKWDKIKELVEKEGYDLLTIQKEYGQDSILYWEENRKALYAIQEAKAQEQVALVEEQNKARQADLIGANRWTAEKIKLLDVELKEVEKSYYDQIIAAGNLTKARDEIWAKEHQAVLDVLKKYRIDVIDQDSALYGDLENLLRHYTDIDYAIKEAAYQRSYELLKESGASEAALLEAQQTALLEKTIEGQNWRFQEIKDWFSKSTAEVTTSFQDVLIAYETGQKPILEREIEYQRQMDLVRRDAATKVLDLLKQSGIEAESLSEIGYQKLLDMVQSYNNDYGAMQKAFDDLAKQELIEKFDAEADILWKDYHKKLDIADQYSLDDSALRNKHNEDLLALAEKYGLQISDTHQYYYNRLIGILTSNGLARAALLEAQQEEALRLTENANTEEVQLEQKKQDEQIKIIQAANAEKLDQLKSYEKQILESTTTFSRDYLAIIQQIEEGKLATMRDSELVELEKARLAEIQAIDETAGKVNAVFWDYYQGEKERVTNEYKKKELEVTQKYEEQKVGIIKDAILKTVEMEKQLLEEVLGVVNKVYEQQGRIVEVTSEKWLYYKSVLNEVANEMVEFADTSKLMVDALIKINSAALAPFDTLKSLQEALEDIKNTSIALEDELTGHTLVDSLDNTNQATDGLNATMILANSTANEYNETISKLEFNMNQYAMSIINSNEKLLSFKGALDTLNLTYMKQLEIASKYGIAQEEVEKQHLDNISNLLKKHGIDILDQKSKDYEQLSALLDLYGISSNEKWKLIQEAEIEALGGLTSKARQNMENAKKKQEQEIMAMGIAYKTGITEAEIKWNETLDAIVYYNKLTNDKLVKNTNVSSQEIAQAYKDIQDKYIQYAELVAIKDYSLTWTFEKALKNLGFTAKEIEKLTQTAIDQAKESLSAFNTVLIKSSGGISTLDNNIKKLEGTLHNTGKSFEEMSNSWEIMNEATRQTLEPVGNMIAIARQLEDTLVTHSLIDALDIISEGADKNYRRLSDMRRGLDMVAQASNQVSNIIENARPVYNTMPREENPAAVNEQGLKQLAPIAINISGPVYGDEASMNKLAADIERRILRQGMR